MMRSAACVNFKSGLAYRYSIEKVTLDNEAAILVVTMFPLINRYRKFVRLQRRFWSVRVGAIGRHFVILQGNLIDIPLIEFGAMAEPEFVRVEPIEPAAQASILSTELFNEAIISHVDGNFYLAVLQTAGSRHIPDTQ